MDESGNSEGNFSVVALKSQNFNAHLYEGNFSCPYFMVPVAQFYYGESLVNNIYMHVTYMAHISYIGYSGVSLLNVK